MIWKIFLLGGYVLLLVFFGYNEHKTNMEIKNTLAVEEKRQENSLLPAPKIKKISEMSETYVQGNLSVEYWEVDGMPCLKINSGNPSFSCDWFKNTRQDLMR